MAAGARAPDRPSVAVVRPSESALQASVNGRPADAWSQVDLVILDMSIPFWKPVSNLFPSARRLLFDSESEDGSLSIEELTLQLSRCSGFVYFGHAHTDLEDAFAGHLLLGRSTGFVPPDISNIDLSSCRVGFVIACGSGQPNPHLGAPLSIASSFAAGGCSQVIGTLWPVYPKIGYDFIKGLMLDGGPYRAAWQHLVHADPRTFAPFLVIEATAAMS